MKQKGFTLIELLVVVAIIGTLSAVGVVAYNGYTNSAKEKTTELNYRNINKSLMFEFMKCEIDSSNIVFNNHSCGNSNPPSTSIISNYIKIVVNPNLNINKKNVIKKYLKDHRVFMTSVVAALVFGGNWTIYDKDSIKTSFPSFLKLIKDLRN